MNRREFITLLGGAAVWWPDVARGQQADRMRRIGVLMHLAADDPEGQRRVAVFLQGLQEAGWAVGRNVDIDMRWAGGETERFRQYAMEIIALTPDVILASATPSVLAVQQATRTVPIVFVLAPDAVGAESREGAETVTNEPTRFFMVHLQKTAGTSLRDRFRATLPDSAIYPNATDGRDKRIAVISLTYCLSGRPSIFEYA